MREPNELFTVETSWISEDTTSIDDSDSLVRAQQNLIYITAKFSKKA